MKILVQWALRDATDWIQLDSSQWNTLPKRPIPASLGGLNNQQGWVNNLDIQGLIFNGFDHYAVEAVLIGLDEGMKVTVWNDDPEGYPVGQRLARIWTFLPLTPDPTWDFAINGRQSQVIYAEGDRYDRLLASSPQNTVVRPWSEFLPPPDTIVRHGVWLTDQKYAEHIAAQTLWGCERWVDHVHDDEVVVIRDGRRQLAEQRPMLGHRKVELLPLLLLTTALAVSCATTSPGSGAEPGAATQAGPRYGGVLRIGGTEPGSFDAVVGRG